MAAFIFAPFYALKRFLIKDTEAEPWRNSDTTDLKTGLDYDDYDNVSRPNWPLFKALPMKQQDPQGSAWGLWGPEDELGTLNLITAEISRLARNEMEEGIAISLK